MILQRQPAITAAQLSEALEHGPTDRVAILPAKTPLKALAETLAAMANGNGGLVILGAGKRGDVQPDNDEEAMLELVEQASLMTEPPLVLPTGHALEMEDGTVVTVQVPPGLPHIYSLRGQYLIRTEAANRQLSTVELRRLLLERGDAGFEAQLVPGATMADLDEERVLRYLDQLSFVAIDDMQQALLARGCAGYAASSAKPRKSAKRKRDAVTLAPTVAGMLLFGSNPQQFLRNAEVICVRYAGDVMGDEFVRQDLVGTLGDQIRQAEGFVMSNMRRGVKIRGFEREDTTEYPIAVVREAIVNAVAHRDYGVRGEGIRLLLFGDRLEVYSPGRLPGHVTLDNLVEERYSRNEAIVSVLSDMGYIERLGYGIDRMIATMHEHGLPAPLFEETPAGFKVTLRSAKVGATGPALAARLGSNLFLNERQELALDYVQEQGRITNSEYQQLVPEVSPETIRRDLADLVEKNVLLRIGEKRATYYILK